MDMCLQIPEITSYLGRDVAGQCNRERKRNIGWLGTSSNAKHKIHSKPTPGNSVLFERINKISKIRGKSKQLQAGEIQIIRT